MNKDDPGYVVAVIDQKDYDLTFAQQDFIKRAADKITQEYTLLDLTRETYKDDTMDKGSLEYSNVRKYVAKVKRGKVVGFTRDQVEFMEANGHVMKALEIAKTIFPDKDLVPLSSETQIIAKYLKSIGLDDNAPDQEEVYRAPKSVTALVKKINIVDPMACWNPNDLTPLQRKCLETLKSYFVAVRFVTYMQKIYTEVDERHIMEEEYIKAVYNKPDLNTEELNMYITLCAEYVSLYKKEKSKNLLDIKINDTLEDQDTDDNKKLYMSFVELAGKFETEINQTKKRIETLQKNLSSTRSDRIKNQTANNASLTKFVEEWKSEQGRKDALRIAEAKNLKLKDEVERIRDMPEYIANVMGIGEDELLEN